MRGKPHGRAIRAPVLKALCLQDSQMSKVQYFNHKTMKALFIGIIGLDEFIKRKGNLGELLLRDCIRERGKNKKKIQTKTFHADFTFEEIPERLENETPKSDSNFIIKGMQAEAPQVNASFSTPQEREQWLNNTFKLIDNDET